MTIKYDEVILKIIHEGTPLDIASGSLLDIDTITGKAVSKFDLLKMLINNINDTYIKSTLTNIRNQYSSNMYDDNECNNFSFILTTKGKNAIVMPVIYNQREFDSKQITKIFTSNDSVYSVFNTYGEKYETDPKNIQIIYDILDKEKKLLKDNITNDDMKCLQPLDNIKKSGTYLDEETYKYYTLLKSSDITINSRNESIINLISNINKSQYKKHMLLSVEKLYRNTQPIENEEILNSNSKYYKDMQDQLEDLTKRDSYGK